MTDSAPATNGAAACPLCGSTRLHYLFSIGTERVVRCADCGVLKGPARLRDAPARDSLAPDVARWSAALQVAGAPPPGQIWCAPAVGAAGRDALRQLGYDVAPEGEALAGPGKRYAAIVAADGLNHAEDPARLLQDVHRALQPGGVLCIWTPSFSDWSGQNPGAAGAIAGRHYFSASNLQSALFRAAFRELTMLRFQPGAPSAPPADDGGCIVIGRAAPVTARPTLSVIVAIYNEAATVAAALDQITAKQVPGLDIEVILVESNSTDGTREIVQRHAAHPRVKLVLEDRPRGQGHAVREGLRHATGDFVLIQDADLEYDLEDYDSLLEPLLAGRTAFVLGARHGGQTWKIRKFTDQPLQAMVLNFAHRGFTALINVSLGLQLSDPFTMYKVFRRDCLHGLTLECNRFDFDWELLIKLVRKGHRPIEIPVNYRSRSFKEGKKIRMIRDPLTWIRAWAKARFGALT